MSAHLSRAQLLLQQSRPADAEREAALAAAQSPNLPQAHALLALSRLALNKHALALMAARTAIGLAPDSAYYHYVHALALHRISQDKESLAAVQEAIRLAPEDEDNFSLLAAIQLQLGDWAAALEAAGQALALNPEHIQAANFRAMALVRLGRKDEAVETVATVLERAPENASSHANQGWNCLHRNDPRQAQEYFREALRLDPELEYARQGMVEALKARNPVYRVMLTYFLWIGRIARRFQWAVIAGTFFGSRFLAGLAFAHPDQKWLWWAVLGAFYGFLYLTWTAVPMFNLFLRVDRFGRHALSREQRVASNWFAPFFAAALAATAWFFFTDTDAAFFAMFFAAALSICVAATFLRRGSSRLWLGLSSGVLALFAVLALSPLLSGHQSVNGFTGFFIYGFLGFQILANLLARK